MQTFPVSYSMLNSIKTARSLTHCYVATPYCYILFLVDNPKEAIYQVFLERNGADAINFETTYKASASLYSTMDDGVADQFIKYKPFTASIGIPRQVAEKSDVPKFYACSHNYGDRCTWYQKALQIVGEIPSTLDSLTYTSAHTYWIDEYRITSDTDLSKRVQVYINTVPQITYDTDGERSIASGITINFENGTVIFSTSQTGKTITIDYWYSTTSEWSFAPVAGKLLKVDRIEAQFTRDIQAFNDWFLFDVMSGTTRVGGQRYRSGQDIHNWANIGSEIIPICEMARSTIIFPWDYITQTIIKSSLNMSVVCRLKHNKPFTWPNQTKNDFATITFYCISEIE